MSALTDKLRKLRRPFCTMVVAAAGSSSRMGEDKLFLPLGGAPVLARTLLNLEACEAVSEIILVTREDSLERCAALCRQYAVSKAGKILIGGQERLNSAFAGVMEASPEAGLIGIHDGARPFASPELITRVVDAASRYQAAAPGIPVKDTIKLTDGDVTVLETPPRERLTAVQTPQVFQADLIKCALTNAVRKGLSFTDDCAAVEAIGGQIHLVPGYSDNLKLTEPMDLTLAELILQRRSELP